MRGLRPGACARGLCLGPCAGRRSCEKARLAPSPAEREASLRTSSWPWTPPRHAGSWDQEGRASSPRGHIGGGRRQRTAGESVRAGRRGPEQISRSECSRRGGVMLDREAQAAGLWVTVKGLMSTIQKGRLRGGGQLAPRDGWLVGEHKRGLLWPDRGRRGALRSEVSPGQEGL